MVVVEVVVVVVVVVAVVVVGSSLKASVYSCKHCETVSV